MIIDLAISCFIKYLSFTDLYTNREQTTAMLVTFTFYEFFLWARWGGGSGDLGKKGEGVTPVLLRSSIYFSDIEIHFNYVNNLRYARA